MLRRLLLGLIEGLVIGATLGVVAARGMGLSAPSSFVLTLLAAAAGFFAGLVAGRPVWGREAKTEALLKAAVGALAGAGLAFAARRWLTAPLDLRAYQLGSGPAGTLAAATLPLISVVLSLFFELDDDAPKARLGSARARQRLAETQASTKLDDPNELDQLDDPNELDQRQASRGPDERGRRKH